MTKILAFSGRKESGKDTLANFLVRNRVELDLGNVRKYALAGPLKQVCVDFFGLTESQVWGTNEEKNTLTNIRWTDLPGFDDWPAAPDRDFMTAREVLQYVGTEIFRRMREDCHTHALRKTIEREKPELALVTDVRFPNEVQGIQKAGGKVIRLMRKIHNDSHKSETALDGYDGFDGVIDNREQTVEESNQVLVSFLEYWGWVKCL